MDKRDIAQTFRERLGLLIQRADGNLARFADKAGLDRSALSQFLAPGTTRLPRAESLCRIAEFNGVSLDWLLGVSQSETSSTEVAPGLTIERVTDENGKLRLDAWHAEATGYKIRYVPAILPDLLRLDEVTAFEYGSEPEGLVSAKADQSRRQLDYSRRPETDMEVCMPRQTLEALAGGEGMWAELPDSLRRHQIDHMAHLLDELYPTFRLFLYDARKVFSAPYTVFGPLRAAIYMGDLYVVVNAVEQIRSLSQHFDGLIRLADVTPTGHGAS